MTITRIPEKYRRRSHFHVQCARVRGRRMSSFQRRRANTAQNEFLLDRLVLLCSAVILRFVNVSNACYILGEATHYHALQLIESLEDYIMINLETFLESRLLDELPHALIKHLSFYISNQQKLKSRYSRTSEVLDGLLAKHYAWVEDQDWPTPILPKDNEGILAMLQRDARIGTTKLSPAAPLTPAPSLGRKGSRLMVDGSVKLDHPPSPKTPCQIPAGDDIFLMDNLESTSNIQQEVRKESAGPSTSRVWKAPAAPRFVIPRSMVHLFMISIGLT